MRRAASRSELADCFSNTLKDGTRRTFLMNGLRSLRVDRNTRPQLSALGYRETNELVENILGYVGLVTNIVNQYA